MSRKKSQITLLMAIALVIVLVFAVFYIISNESIKRKLGIGTSKGLTSDIAPIREFIQQCLDRTAKDGLKMLGKQGGRIYGTICTNDCSFEQGGKLRGDILDSDNGKQGSGGIPFVKIEDNDCKAPNNKNFCYVHYGIEEVTSSSPLATGYPYFKKGETDELGSQKYPWVKFPYLEGAHNDESPHTGDATFGKNQLVRDVTIFSMEEDLKNYVEKRIPDCTKFDAFVEQGYKITPKARTADVKINPDDVRITLAFPVEIENPSTGEKNNLKDFLSVINVRLKLIYDEANKYIKKDVQQTINFNLLQDVPMLSEFTNLGLTISLQGHPDTCIADNIESIESCKRDDIIDITDTKNTIDGNPYIFRFARRNRAPALSYLFGNCKMDAGVYSCSNQFSTCIKKNDGEDITMDEIIPLNYKCSTPSCCSGGKDCLEKYLAFDPDDKMPLNGEITVLSGSGQIGSGLKSPATIKVMVTDADGLSDWQILRFTQLDRDCTT